MKDLKECRTTLRKYRSEAYRIYRTAQLGPADLKALTLAEKALAVTDGVPELKEAARAVAKAREAVRK